MTVFSFNFSADIIEYALGLELIICKFLPPDVGVEVRSKPRKLVIDLDDLCIYIVKTGCDHLNSPHCGVQSVLNRGQIRCLNYSLCHTPSCQL